MLLFSWVQDFVANWKIPPFNEFTFTFTELIQGLNVAQKLPNPVESICSMQTTSFQLFFIYFIFLLTVLEL